VALVWDIAIHYPLPFLGTVSLQIANGSCNGLYAWLTAGVINGLVAGHGAVPWSAAFGAALALENVSSTFMGPARSWLANLAVLRIQRRVLEHAAAQPLLRFADSEWVDRLARGTRDLGDRLGGWLGGIFDLLGAGVQVLGMLLAVFALGGGATMITALILASVVNIVSQGRVVRVELQRAQRQARPRRELERWAWLAMGRAAAAEVRTFGIGHWLRARWEAAYLVCAEEDLAAARLRLRWDGISNAADIGAYVAVLVLASQAALHAGPDRAAGVFAALLEAAVTMQGFLSSLFGAAGRMYAHGTFVGDLAPLLRAGGPIPQAAQGAIHSAAHIDVKAAPDADGPRPASVRIDRVSFRYPRAAADALRGITAEIRPGEVVALVGPNGAGKSTLAAIVLGLLVPDSGTVRLDDEGSVPRGASAVFQDFVRYTLPIRDNVAFGSLDRHGADADLRVALKQAGSPLAEGDLDEWLGPEFGGRDLSGGEWLRLAVARGLVGHRGVLVLDEPTAAIDPLAEIALVRQLLDPDYERTILIVSHRLGIARAADRILVLDSGCLVEEGDHNTLLRRGGLYSRMWRVQASWYGPLDAPGSERAAPESGPLPGA
jgi:ATP-binding cassette subfamily B protein